MLQRGSLELELYANALAPSRGARPRQESEMSMKNFPLTCALLVGSLAGAASAQAGEPGLPAEMEKLDHEMQRAFVTRDVKFLRDLLTDDYVLITSSSRIVSKEEVLASVVDPGQVLEVNDSSEVTVRRHGDTAVVTAVLHQRGTSNGKPFDYRVRYTDTWVLEGGRWRYMSAHASLLPAPPSAK
jgi:ketosteroid isomerase-like protein